MSVRWFVTYVDVDGENYVLATDEELAYMLLHDKVTNIVRCEEG